MRAFKPFAAVFLYALSFHAPASTQRWEVVSDGIRGKLVAEVIGEVVGGRGESQESVLHRAGAALVAYSKDTGFEACAEICTSGAGDGRRFGFLLTTVKSHLGCPVLPVCPAGFSPGEGNIHSHGATRPYRINRADAALSHYAVGEMQKAPHNHFQFSGEDLAGSAGVWLARPDGLLFASRKGEGLRFVPTPSADEHVVNRGSLEGGLRLAVSDAR